MSHSSFNFVSLEWLLYFGADFWWIYFFSSVNCLVLDYLGILVTNCKPWHQWPPCKINVLICYISDRLCIRFAYWICMFSEIWVTIILEVPCHTNFHQICWDCMFLYTCALTFFSILIYVFLTLFLSLQRSLQQPIQWEFTVFNCWHDFSYIPVRNFLLFILMIILHYIPLQETEVIFMICGKNAEALLTINYRTDWLTCFKSFLS